MSVHQSKITKTTTIKISLNFELRTHLDEAREESGFLDAVRDVEKLQNGEQLAETHHKAHRVKGVGHSICSQKQRVLDAHQSQLGNILLSQLMKHFCVYWKLHSATTNEPLQRNKAAWCLFVSDSNRTQQTDEGKEMIQV